LYPPACKPCGLEAKPEAKFLTLLFLRAMLSDPGRPSGISPSCRSLRIGFRRLIPPKTDSNRPKISIPALKINVDNKAYFRYPADYAFRLLEAPIFWAAAKSGTQGSIFDSSASKKKLLIFKPEH
ncbi:MAG: hypothetical protein KJP23_14560, partial [Deltaproteobacteria bacterium]|nr:hypothetical protein [Deltaproteobacteria bacterium]